MNDNDWRILVDRIRTQKCTLFVGAGASAHVLPTAGEIAERWSREHKYVLPERAELARVAQYMAITGDPQWPKSLIAEMCKAIDPVQAFQPGDVYDMIAKLDLPMFITTNYDNLLVHALQAKGKAPRQMICPWHESLKEYAKGKDEFGKDKFSPYKYEPSPDGPVVYHLHGSAEAPDSIVITEDDYLDFIVWVTRRWKEQPSHSLIAPALMSALSKTSLVFIGYSLGDWSFRVLMRSIKQAGSSIASLNMAVQLSPLDNNADAVDRKKVEDYLTEYFGRVLPSPVRLYLGTADAFLKELTDRLVVEAS